MLSVALSKLNELGVKVVPFGIDEDTLKKIKECIVYEYEAGSKINRFSLKIRIIAPTLSRCIAIKELILDKFISLSDTSKINDFTKIELTGGGSFKDDYNNVIHLLMGLNFTERLNYD